MCAWEESGEDPQYPEQWANVTVHCTSLLGNIYSYYLVPSHFNYAITAKEKTVLSRTVPFFRSVFLLSAEDSEQGNTVRLQHALRAVLTCSSLIVIEYEADTLSTLPVIS